MYKILLALAFLFFLGISSLTVIPQFVEREVRDQIRNPDDKDLSSFDTILILGGKVYLGETLSPILKTRVRLASELYHQGIVETVLVAGEKNGKNQNEVHAIKKVLLINGVAEQDILTDENGASVMASLSHAKNSGQNSLLIPAPIHELPRILYTANALEMQTLGIIAEDDEMKDSAYSAKEKLLTLFTFFRLLFQ